MRRLTLLLVLGIAACGHDKNDNEPVTPKEDARVPLLRDSMNLNLKEAEGIRDPETGWLVHGDCDSAIWSGKYCAASGVSGVHMEAAEWPDQPGRFDRTPPPGACTSTDPDWSSWSRDMGIGLMACAWEKKDLALLQRHAAYGKDNDWLMGKPLGDARSVYTPATIGRLYETIFALGGEDNINRLWPDYYPSGLTDYQAHLQVMGIWHRGEVETALLQKGNSGDAKPKTDPVPDDASKVDSVPPSLLLLGVSNQQLERLQEHAARDPHDPLFQAVLGTYTGDMGPALDVCLDPSMPVGEYVRCGEDFRRCQLAAWIFACDIVLRRFGG